MKKALIIGAGPAGISASLYLARSGIASVTVVSNGISSLEKAEKIENYFGFAEPVSGAELLENGKAGAKRLGVKIIEAELLELNLTSDLRFEAETTIGKETYDSVLIATGAARKKPDIEGVKEFEGKGVSYCAVCDAFFYRGKSVAVIGDGEYAVHEAVTLSSTSSDVTILTNGNSLKAELPGNIKCIDKKITAVAGNSRVESVLFEDNSRLEASGVFIAVGTAGSTEIARKIGAAADEKKIYVGQSMETNIPGLYAAGDCTGGLLQVSKAVSEGAAAAMSMIRFLKNSGK